VEIPDQVLEVPLADELVALGVMEQGRGELAVERMPVVQGVSVELDDIFADFVAVRAAEASDVCRLSK
jgi:hypothetical protein